MSNDDGQEQDSRNPVVACAADDPFALPLAVTITSLLKHLRPERRLTLYVLDGGISQENRRRLAASWESQRVSVHWLQPSVEMLEGLPVSGHVNLLTYFRILLPTVLPASVGRAIYLDSDLLVLGDLAELWDRPLEGRLCLAVPDQACPYMDAARFLPNYRRAAQYLVAIRPVPNYASLGIAPEAKYFNAGVLSIDLEGWREAELTSRLLQCLRDHRRHVRYWDQYALNVVLAGCWGELDPRWNQIAHIYQYPSWQESPFDQRHYEAIVSDPYIVHFSSPSKPWHNANRHAYRDRFFEYVDQTAWAGWRPQRLPGDWRRDFDRLVQRAILYAGRKYRLLRAHLGID